MEKTPRKRYNSSSRSRSRKLSMPHLEQLSLYPDSNPPALLLVSTSFHPAPSHVEPMEPQPVNETYDMPGLGAPARVQGVVDTQIDPTMAGELDQLIPAEVSGASDKADSSSPRYTPYYAPRPSAWRALRSNTRCPTQAALSPRRRVHPRLTHPSPGRPSSLQ